MSDVPDDEYFERNPPPPPPPDIFREWCNEIVPVSQHMADYFATSRSLLSTLRGMLPPVVRGVTTLAWRRADRQLAQEQQRFATAWSELTDLPSQYEQTEDEVTRQSLVDRLTSSALNEAAAQLSMTNPLERHPAEWVFGAPAEQALIDYFDKLPGIRQAVATELAQQDMSALRGFDRLVDLRDYLDVQMGEVDGRSRLGSRVGLALETGGDEARLTAHHRAWGEINRQAFMEQVHAAAINGVIGAILPIAGQAARGMHPFIRAVTFDEVLPGRLFGMPGDVIADTTRLGLDPVTSERLVNACGEGGPRAFEAWNRLTDMWHGSEKLGSLMRYRDRRALTKAVGKLVTFPDFDKALTDWYQNATPAERTLFAAQVEVIDSDGNHGIDGYMRTEYTSPTVGAGIRARRSEEDPLVDTTLRALFEGKGLRLPPIDMDEARGMVNRDLHRTTEDPSAAAARSELAASIEQQIGSTRSQAEATETMGSLIDGLRSLERDAPEAFASLMRHQTVNSEMRELGHAVFSQLTATEAAADILATWAGGDRVLQIQTAHAAERVREAAKLGNDDALQAEAKLIVGLRNGLRREGSFPDSVVNDCWSAIAGATAGEQGRTVLTGLTRWVARGQDPANFFDDPASHAVAARIYAQGVADGAGPNVASLEPYFRNEVEAGGARAVAAASPWVDPTATVAEAAVVATQLERGGVDAVSVAAKMRERVSPSPVQPDVAQSTSGQEPAPRPAPEVANLGSPDPAVGPQVPSPAAVPDAPEQIARPQTTSPPVATSPAGTEAAPESPPRERRRLPSGGFHPTATPQGAADEGRVPDEPTISPSALGHADRDIAVTGIPDPEIEREELSDPAQTPDLDTDRNASEQGDERGHGPDL